MYLPGLQEKLVSQPAFGSQLGFSFSRPSQWCSVVDRLSVSLTGMGYTTIPPLSVPLPRVGVALVVTSTSPSLGT